MLRLYFMWTCPALFLAGCSSPSASQRPNFSGDWVPDKANTKVEFTDISNLESVSYVIEHHEPIFKVQRTFTMVVGR